MPAGGRPRAVTIRILPLLVLTLEANVRLAAAQSADTTTCHASVDRKAVTGRIVDDHTGAPMMGVSVVLDARRPDTAFDRDTDTTSRVTLAPASHLTAELDATGRFCFSDLRSGEYRMAIYAMREDASHQAVFIRLRSSDALKTVTLRYRPFGRSPEEEAVIAAMLRALDENRQRWIQSRPRHYLLRVRYACGLCSAGAPETYEMLDGAAVARVDSSGARHALWAGVGVPTIESMFTTLRAKLLDESDSVTAVAYDPRFGWPSHFQTDARLPVTDAGAKVTIERFDVLP